VKSTLPKSGTDHIAIGHNFLPHIRNHETDKKPSPVQTKNKIVFALKKNLRKSSFFTVTILYRSKK
jgi:hypothetical protein